MNCWRRRAALVALLAFGLVPIGCGWPTEIDTTYGRTRGPSINGTATFAEILRGRGHEVRPAVRANDSLAKWADVVVRFAPQPGPVERAEGEWLAEWLRDEPDRRLIYIPCDFDAEPEFWDAILKAQPKGTDPSTIKSIEKKRIQSRTWVSDLPPRAKLAADAATWIEFEPKPATSTICKSLEGRWAEGVDAAASAISKHEVFKVAGGEDLLLSGDGSPLAIGWSYANQSRVLALANASFLLNASLMNRAKRPLAIRVADWIGEAPRHVAFLEGRRVALSESEENQESQNSQFHLLGVDPFNWIIAHFLIFLFLFAFSLAVRLGRASPDPASGVERPSAHPEALGAMLARTGRADAARYLLETYRRWRQHSQLAGRSSPTTPPSPTTR